MSAAAANRRWITVFAALAAGIVVFIVGIALGEALHDAPSSGGTQTIIRTVQPIEPPSDSTRTVTVTTSSP